MLRTLARRFGRGRAVESLIREESRRVLEAVRPLCERTLAGAGVAVAGDPWTASALCRALSELGVDACLVAVLRRATAGDPILGTFEQPGRTVLIDPDHADFERELRRRSTDGVVEAVVGSAVSVDAARQAGVPFLEVSAPHYLEHFATPSPYMGFAGMARLAERLANAVGRRRHAAAHPGRRPGS
jgi:nitrogenase molybdenum-iron protein alpha/beta subunit